MVTQSEKGECMTVLAFLAFGSSALPGMNGCSGWLGVAMPGKLNHSFPGTHEKPLDMTGRTNEIGHVQWIAILGIHAVNTVQSNF
jgi:hypothetical protein